MCRWEDIVCVQRGGCVENEREHNFDSSLKKRLATEMRTECDKMSHVLSDRCVKMAHFTRISVIVSLITSDLDTQEVGI